MRSKFDEQLALLNRELTEMGTLCEESIGVAATALRTGGKSAAKTTLSLDEEIDQKERDVESLCLKLLLQQQPVARDLRQISAALKMITDMERIGDQAADISEIIGYLNGRTGAECTQIVAMADAAMQMVRESVGACVRRDLDLANAVIAYDDVVDGLFSEVKTALIGLIAKDPADGEYALDLLMIAKYFERIGDHATNIAEWAVFSVTGVHNGLEEL